MVEEENPVGGAYCDRAKAHPEAVRLMPEDFFWNTADDFTPFGSDEGSESYHSWREWRQQNPTSSSFEYIAGILDGRPQDYNDALLEAARIEAALDPHNYDDEDPFETSYDPWTLDVTIIATGLSQLVDEGRIDPETKPLMRTAVKRQRSSVWRTSTWSEGAFETDVLDAIDRVIEAA